MFENIRADVSRYEELGLKWRSEPGFWIVANYRFGRWALEQVNRIFRGPLVAIHRVTSIPIRLVLGSEVSREAEVGPGLVIFHGHSVIIPSGSRVGRDCSIYHEVTLGLLASRPGVPQLEDHVVVFSGARVLGGITIGAHAEIGTCCVVSRDVPAGAVVVAPPPRILRSEMVGAVRSVAPKPNNR